VAPLDPGRDWLAAGITGLARQREWDAVATTEGPGEPGDEVEYVALPDGQVLMESAPAGFDPAFLVSGLHDVLDPPYRAVAVRRPELWAIGAVAMETAQLDPDPRGDDLALTWDGETLTLLADGLPTDPSGAEALEALATARLTGPYAAHAHRLDGDLWEISILAL
jgi:hypothetical protein